MNTMFKTNELNQKNQMFWSTARNEKPVYKQFAASKMSQAVKPNSIVEFTSFLGETYKVPCRNNTEIKKAMAFFAMMKRESAVIRSILNEYPIVMGKIPKKFIPQLRKDLKALKLSNKAIQHVIEHF